MQTSKRILLLIFLLIIIVSGCSSSEDQRVLLLATTTSTDNSGLLHAILPEFEAQFNARVDVIAVGTGQALALGEAGDVDIILVHARVREEQFLAEGYGLERFDVMYNDFVIVGPVSDPANIGGTALAADALLLIADAEADFASRGDDSGTHIKEISLWEASGFSPSANFDWYLSLGQGMGDTLLFANETGAYTITDRGTFLAMQARLPELVILVGGRNIEENLDPTLFNPYGLIPIHPGNGYIRIELALEFAAWLTSVETQQLISEFGLEEFGQPLFYPDSEDWRER